MINRLVLRNCFKHSDASFDFQNGLTAITGPNECGKSLILEMIRYALFGTKALRGVAADHKGTFVGLYFAIKGAHYMVERQGSKCKLFSGDTQVASGSTAVNAKIVDLLGYDLLVFDTANACNQGAVEAFGAMKPSERKNMVDQTIGLTAVDATMQQVKERYDVARKAAVSIRENLVAPIAPDIPEGYVHTDQLVKSEADLQPLARECFELTAWRDANRDRTAPVKPECAVEEEAGLLYIHESQRLNDERDLQLVRAELSGLPVPERTPEQVAEIEQGLAARAAFEEAQAFLATCLKPKFSSKELRTFRATWTAIDIFKDRDNLLKRIESLEGTGHHTCPKCSYEWPFEHKVINQLTAEFNEKFAVIEGNLPPSNPPLVLRDIAKCEDLIDVWESEADARAKYEAVPEAVKPDEDQADLLRYRLQLEGQERRIELLKRLGELQQGEPLADRSADLEARRRYDILQDLHVVAVKEFGAFLIEQAEKENRFQEIMHAPDQLDEIRAAIALSMSYEQLRVTYDHLRGSYLDQLTSVQMLEQEAEQYGLARDALKALKVRVKAFLIPSLNTVASNLLSNMTLGARTMLVVDDDFNIVVDGQPLNTLSGSAKAVAGLATRVALGQVLTNRVFSVFMGDEIDESMDNERAEATANCFQGLTDNIQQVVLVSHKKPDADHYIEL